MTRRTTVSGKPRGSLWAKAALLLYAAVLLYVLFFEDGLFRPSRLHQREPGLRYIEDVASRIYLKPFATIGSYLKEMQKNGLPGGLWDYALVNTLGNVLLFVPLGVLLPCVWRRQRNPLICFSTMVLIVTLAEAAQALTLVGTCDIDDVILNVLGGCIGMAIEGAVRWLWGRRNHGGGEEED